MWKGIHIVSPHTRIDFIGQRYVAFAFSFILIAGTIFLLATKGLNFGIDFTGGTLIEVAVEGGNTDDLTDLRTALNDLKLGEMSLQQFGTPQDLLVRVPGQDGGPAAQKAAVDQVKNVLASKFTGLDYRRTEFVGPQVGQELKMKGIYAVLFSMIGIMIYVWVRFEWQFGVSAVVATLHDVFAVLGFFALTGKTFDLATLAAVLMVGGMSINDTVVIFDRIREIMRKYKKMPMAEVCNMAINETLSRTIVTGLTVVLSLVALLVFGGEVIRGFIEALLFGFVVGTLSSVYVASALLLYLGVRPDKEVPDAEKDGDVKTA